MDTGSLLTLAVPCHCALARSYHKLHPVGAHVRGKEDLTIEPASCQGLD